MTGSTASQTGELVVVRHGETLWSRSGRHTGLTDVPLTPAGEAQASLAGRALADRRFALVLVSPLGRARRTVERLGYPEAKIEDNLAEWDYGPVEGLTREQIQADLGFDWSALADGVRQPLTISGTEDAPAAWRNPHPGPGELAEEVAARAARVIARVEPTLQEGRDVLLVAHGHLLRILACAWLGLHPGTADRLDLGTAARSVLGYGRGLRSLIRWNLPPEVRD